MSGRKFTRIDLTKFFITVARNATNTFSATEADWIGFKANPTEVMMPEPNFVEINEVGDGTGLETLDGTLLDNWPAINIAISGIVNFHVTGLMTLRANGGSVTDAEVTTSTSYTHTNDNLAPTTSTPVFFHIILANDDVAFCYRVCANDITFSQSEANRPTYTANLKAYFWKEVGDVVGLDISAITAAPDYTYAHGKGTSVTYNDGASVDATASGGARLLEVTAGINNNIGEMNLADGTFFTSGDYKSGAMPDGVFRGKVPQNGLVSFKLLPDGSDSMREYDKLIAGTQITNVIVKFQGDKIGASSDRYFLQIKYPKARYIGLQSSPQNSPIGDVRAFSVPLKVAHSSGVLTNVVVQNGDATMV